MRQTPAPLTRTERLLRVQTGVCYIDAESAAVNSVAEETSF